MDFARLAVDVLLLCNVPSAARDVVLAHGRARKRFFPDLATNDYDRLQQRRSPTFHLELEWSVVDLAPVSTGCMGGRLPSKPTVLDRPSERRDDDDVRLDVVRGWSIAVMSGH